MQSGVFHLSCFFPQTTFRLTFPPAFRVWATCPYLPPSEYSPPRVILIAFLPPPPDYKHLRVILSSLITGASPKQIAMSSKTRSKFLDGAKPITSRIVTNWQLTTYAGEKTQTTGGWLWIHFAKHMSRGKISLSEVINQGNVTRPSRRAEAIKLFSRSTCSPLPVFVFPSALFSLSS